MTDYEHILTENPADGVGVIRLNRPKALNALNNALLKEVQDALRACDADSDIGCIIITGSDRAFAAGADIKEMEGKSQVEMVMADSLVSGFNFSTIKKPIIAAVSGYA
ncbi:MAG: enoyl-CoA hydratase-related protein, partial [Aggregatilineales bacterium]